MWGPSPHPCRLAGKCAVPTERVAGNKPASRWMRLSCPATGTQNRFHTGNSTVKTSSPTLFLLKVYARQPWSSSGMTMGCTGAPLFFTSPPKGRSQFDPGGCPCRAGGGHSGAAPTIHSLCAGCWRAGCASAPGLGCFRTPLYSPPKLCEVGATFGQLGLSSAQKSEPSVCGRKRQ